MSQLSKINVRLYDLLVMLTICNKIYSEIIRLSMRTTSFCEAYATLLNLTLPLAKMIWK